MTTPIKVAVLGGGMAGLATAYGLSNTPERRARYQVTVYQTGWRLGGKCASGRNEDEFGRIEEHGLHVWFGSYENAFRMLRDCYEHYEWPDDAPFATVEEAFLPSDDLVLWDEWDDRWTSTTVKSTRHAGAPGDGQPLAGIDGVIVRIIDHVVESRRASRQGAAGPTATGPGPRTVRRGLIERLGLPALEWLTRRLSRLATSRRAVAGTRRRLERCLRRLRQWLWRHVAEPRLGDDDLRHRFTKADFGLTLVLGFLADDVMSQGFDALNDEDFRAWLRRHGAADATLASPWVTAWYDGAFAYLGGSKDNADIAAGTSLHAVLRQHYGYKGAFVWKLRAGMGETVIAPIYEVLRGRGVHFEFFHRVLSLELDDDKSAVRRIHLDRQPGADPDFEPLRMTGGMRVWPTSPPAASGASGVAPADLDFGVGPPVGQPVALEHGVDFDVAVLAISVGALDQICGELCADAGNPAFAAMVGAARTCMTQSMQLWTTSSAADLGWSHGLTLSSTYTEPLDTYTDMSYLLDWEQWPESANSRGVAYFCGVSPDGPGPIGQRPAPGGAQQGGAPPSVVADIRAYLDDRAGELWPVARDDQGFDWDALVAPSGITGADRLAHQYVRLNWAPSERYVLSPTGSIRHRLRADQSGYPNLVLAGDWTKNDLDVGCVEAAVMSGLDAADTIVGEISGVAGRRHEWEGHGRPRLRPAAAAVITPAPPAGRGAGSEGGPTGRPPVAPPGPASAWTDAALDRMRQQGDPEVDELVADLYPADDLHTHIAAVFGLRADSPTLPDGPLSDYLADRPALPSWCDPKRMEIGRQFFDDWGPAIGSTLFCASLPTGYAAANGVQVLGRTGRMLDGPRRRVMETGQMVIDVMQPGGLEPGAKGWTDLRRVRLMHAAVRRLIQTDPGVDADGTVVVPPWDAAVLGVPLNQEDLLGTLWTFSLTTIDALRRSGVPVSTAEADAYLHVWNVVGHLLGITPGLLPLDLDEARLSFDAIRARQYAACAEGEQMTAALIDLLRELMPWDLLSGLPPSAIRFLAGPQVAALLNVPASNWTRLLFVPARAANVLAAETDRDLPLVANLAHRLGLELWRAVMDLEDRSPGPNFDMPARLRDGWGL